MIRRSFSHRRSGQKPALWNRGVWHKGILTPLRRSQEPGSADGPRERGSPAGKSGEGDISSNYWSSSTYANNPTNAWNVNFNDGNTNANNKTNNNYVRAVRGGS